MMAKYIFGVLCSFALLATGRSQFGGGGNILGSAGNTVTNTAGRVASPVTQTFAQISKDLDASRSSVLSSMGIDGNAKVSSLVPGFEALSGSDIFRCYNSSMGKENFNVFDNQFYDALTAYYVSFATFNILKTDIF